MNNFYPLNFFANPLRPEFKLPALTDDNFNRQQWYLWHYVGDDNFKVISDEIAQWAIDHNLKINNCHIFCGPPNHNSIIHSDGPPNTTQIGINWVLTGLESYMVWYKTTISEQATKTNFSNSEYRQWSDSEVEEVERCQILGPTLINAAEPHRIINNSNKHRWTISLRFQSLTFSTWQETVEFFKPWIKS